MAGYVLIVESDADLQRQVGATLREAGFETGAETDLTWAERSVATRPPDLVVIDTRLSDGDGAGFRLAEALRRSPATKTTPIVFIATSHRGASHRAEARRRFAPADYLPAPIDPAALVPCVQALAGEGRGPASAEEPHRGEVTPGPEPAKPGGAPPALPKRGGSDPAQMQERRDVERSAKHLAADSSPGSLQGTLKRTPFARLLGRLYAERATGSLLLLREPVKKIASFADGYPVSVRSNVPSETLGQILREKRLISADVLAESVQRMQKEKRQQGQILVEMGALSPFNLERALVEQVEAKLFEVFSWPDGKYMFRPGEPPPAHAVRLERPPAALILEGIRRHYHESRRDAVLARYAGHVVALSSDPWLRLQEMTSDLRELAFIRSIDGARPLEAVLSRAEISTEKAKLLMVALSEAGMIEKVESTSRRKAPQPSSTPSAPAIPAPVPPATSVPLGSAQLSMMLQTARTQDYFWVLGVEREATSADIDRAFEGLARNFHPDRYRLAPDEDRRMAQELFERLTEAHETLRDAGRRRVYLAKAARTPQPAILPETPSGSIRGLSTPPPVSTPAGASAAARALYETGLEHLRARRHHEAVEALRQSARLMPNEADYRAALGWALFRQAPADARAGRAAVAELRRALQLNERHREAAQHLAEIFAQTGQPELAVQELERLLAIDPGAVEVADELRRLRAR